MTLTAGALSAIAIGATTATLSSAAATSGTGPYTYQWHRSTTTGFTPGGGTAIAGATSLQLNDSGLIPNTTYFYKVVATDAAAATATSSQLSVTATAMSLSQNVLTLNMVAGIVDQKVGTTNVISVQVDQTQATPIVAGQAVKIVDSAGGVPKVVACSANSDDVFGFVNFDNRAQSFAAGTACEISLKGTVIYLWATAPIARGAGCQLDVTAPACVNAKTASSGAAVVGWAYDKAPSAGTLIRVMLEPSGVLGAVKA